MDDAKVADAKVVDRAVKPLEQRFNKLLKQLGVSIPMGVLGKTSFVLAKNHVIIAAKQNLLVIAHINDLAKFLDITLLIERIQLRIIL
jgi:hypothetical protein